VSDEAQDDVVPRLQDQAACGSSTKEAAIFSQRSIARQSLGTRRRVSSTTMRGRTRCTRLPIVTTSQDAHSGRKRTLIPAQSGQAFRAKADTQSG
jgi:hypothetical protein